MLNVFWTGTRDKPKFHTDQARTMFNRGPTGWWGLPHHPHTAAKQRDREREREKSGEREREREMGGRGAEGENGEGAAVESR